MKIFFMLLLFFSLAAASKTINGFKIKDPLIPIDEILSGGPPRDGIPAINAPKFINAQEALKVFGKQDRALVIGIGDKKKLIPSPFWIGMKW